MDGTRREFLTSLARWTVGSAAAMTMAGCGDVIEGVAASCPTGPEDSHGLDWVPDLTHPVFYGFTDVDAASGAPGPARIWYPTLDGAPNNARILKMCVARWPLVLFLHGQPPAGCWPYPEYYKRWNLMSLARSGYVVVVPVLQREDLPADPGSANLALALRFLDWARSGWEHSTWVSRDVTETALVGHSFGIPVAVQVARQRPAGALVSFSGWWDAFSEDQIALLTTPSMLMEGTLEDYLPPLNPLRWGALPFPKYRLFFERAKHFDYLPDLPGCEEPGEKACVLTPILAAEYSALFISRHVPVPLSRARVYEDMTLAPYELTRQQQFYAGSHLRAIQRLESARIPGCGVDMYWEPSEGVVQERRIGRGGFLP